MKFSLKKEEDSKIQKMLDTTNSSEKELINNALTLLEWAIEEVKNQREIGSLSKDDEFKEVLLPMFKRVAKS
jgi:hypothetical protein